ncbi:MAG: hypothetical protein HS108_14440 [Planctomycetes bacterium]|nr:hypothetical protein [Planctomycetota bacterium]
MPEPISFVFNNKLITYDSAKPGDFLDQVALISATKDIGWLKRRKRRPSSEEFVRRFATAVGPLRKDLAAKLPSNELEQMVALLASRQPELSTAETEAFVDKMLARLKDHMGRMFTVDAKEVIDMALTAKSPEINRLAGLAIAEMCEAKEPSDAELRLQCALGFRLTCHLEQALHNEIRKRRSQPQT